MWSRMNTSINAGENNRSNPDAVLRQMIEERACHIWLENGRGHGDHEHHWFQAEREVLEAAKPEREQRSGGREKKRTGKPH